jgi:hypothetical protein
MRESCEVSTESALPLSLQGEKVGVRGCLRESQRLSLWRRPLIPTFSP